MGEWRRAVDRGQNDKAETGIVRVGMFFFNVTFG